MSLKGKFQWYESLRAGGGKMITFIITCDNLLHSETFDAAIIASNGSLQPMVFRQLSLKPKQSYRFDFDSVDWQWCNGDAFVILGKNDSIVKKWPLNIQTYAPGECPECHGTHKCRQCAGKGYRNMPRYQVERCNACGGTGICQTCYVPVRNVASQLGNGFGVSMSGNMANNDARNRQCQSLRNRIAELQSKIQKTEWDLRMMQLNGTDVSSYSVYSSYNNLIYQYNAQLIRLQSQLESLENI